MRYNRPVFSCLCKWGFGLWVALRYSIVSSQQPHHYMLLNYKTPGSCFAPGTSVTCRCNRRLECSPCCDVINMIVEPHCYLCFPIPSASYAHHLPWVALQHILSTNADSATSFLDSVKNSMQHISSAYRYLTHSSVPVHYDLQHSDSPTPLLAAQFSFFNWGTNK